MVKKSSGFIFLELIAASLIIIVGGISVMNCYGFGVTLMQRNNYKHEAFTLAQENMLLLRENKFDVLLDKTQGNFRIKGSKEILGMYDACNFLLIEVYLGKESKPLVNLVAYD